MLAASALMVAWWSSGATWDTLPALNPEAELVVVPVEAAPQRVGQQVEVRVVIPKPQPAVAWAEGGIVTAIHVQPGDTLSAGQPVLDVAGSALVAYTGVPFHRDLTRGDKGPDVAALRALLRDTGVKVSPEPAQTFDSELRSAVKKWQQDVGIQPADGVLRLASLVRIPAASVSIHEVVAALGAPAPASGGAVLQVDTEPQHLQLRGGRPIEPGDYVLSVAGAQTPVTVDADGAAMAEHLDAILPALGHTDDDGGRQGNGFLAPPEDTVAVRLPGASVLTGLGDERCVALEDGTLAPVTVIDVAPDGAVLVEPTLPEAAKVVANPRQSGLELACP